MLDRPQHRRLESQLTKKETKKMLGFYLLFILNVQLSKEKE
jgi:hypothetical protein